MRPEDSWAYTGWPTLGFLVADWVERHCPIPDGFRRGQPFVMYRPQLYWTVQHYRVRDNAVPAGSIVDGNQVSAAAGFTYRRSQIIAPQKAGKGPWSAAIFLAEACGPVVFDGWSEPGEKYVCADHGCDCGWVRAYDPGEPRGRRWPTPLVQLTATSEDQIQTNVYRPMLAMARLGPLAGMVRAMEGFIAVGSEGRIDVVTAKANSRLGNPVTSLLHDESGIYLQSNGMLEVAKTQRRGVSGMGGRTIETTNAYDPTQGSQAQVTAESKRPDLFRYHLTPPEALNYRLKAERKKIHRFVYAGFSHVDLTVIEAEAAELMETDPPMAERFYGNRTRAGASRAVDMDAWAANADDVKVPKGSLIVLGVDGARFRDSLAIVATHVDSGFQWPVGIWEVPDDLPADELDTYEHPKDEVDAELAATMKRFYVWRTYVDPGGIDEWMRDWQGQYGKDRVVPWLMNRYRPTAFAVRNWLRAIGAHDQSHSGDERLTRHARNAHKKPVNVYDDDHRQMFVLAKERHDSPEKMDGSAAAVLSWEARNDSIAAGARPPAPKRRGRVRGW